MTDTGQTLFQKLAEVTAEIGHVEARGFHSFFKSKYVTEDDLLEAVRTKLTERNVALLPSVHEVTERPTKDAKTHISTVLIDFTFCDGDTGQTHTCRWAGAGEDSGDKGISKAYTSALRYFLLKTFLVSTGEDSQLSETKPAPRADGQKAITAEQYTEILSAWKAAGSDEVALHGLLDAQQIKLNVEGQDLSLAQRVQMLSALQALEVLKKLRAAAPQKAVA